MGIWFWYLTMVIKNLWTDSDICNYSFQEIKKLKLFIYLFIKPEPEVLWFPNLKKKVTEGYKRKSDNRPMLVFFF